MGELEIDLGPLRARALLDEPDAGAPRRSAVLFAHGAELDLDAPFMASIAGGLARRGFLVLRFRYPYMQRRALDGRRRPPDRADALEDAHLRALAFLRLRVGARRVLLAGKSMGGRIATQVAAKGADAAGLVLLGYPLTPAGKPERERSEHFPAIVQPALFLQGDRDALADLTRLRRALGRYGGVATLAVIDGADHGFDLPVRVGRSSADVRADLVDRIAAWELEAFPD